MKRRILMSVLALTVCLVAAPAAVMAEEETAAVTEAAEGTEPESGEAEAETELEVPERPDYTASDYVTLGEYKGLKVEQEQTVVTDEEIEAEIRNNAETAGVLEQLTEGTVQEGDTANIDYVGTLDGEAFDGGTAKDYDLVIGSGSFIDGFEDGLIGVAVGDTVDLPLTFPESYPVSDLAGQEVIFNVTVNSVKRIPELTDELVNTISGGEYSTVAGYQEYIRAELEQNRESERENEILSNLMTQVAGTSTIGEYPQEMLDYGMANMENTYRMYAETYGMEYADFLETYLGMTEDQFQEEALNAVKVNLQQEMYLKAIAEAEGMEISDEEYAAGCENYAEQYGYESAETLVEAYGEDIVRISLLQDKVLDFLKDNAEIVEIVETESETGTEEESGASPEEEAETEGAAETEAETETAQEAETEAPEETETEEAGPVVNGTKLTEVGNCYAINEVSLENGWISLIYSNGKGYGSPMIAMKLDGSATIRGEEGAEVFLCRDGILQLQWIDAQTGSWVSAEDLFLNYNEAAPLTAVLHAKFYDWNGEQQEDKELATCEQSADSSRSAFDSAIEQEVSARGGSMYGSGSKYLTFQDEEGDAVCRTDDGTELIRYPGKDASCYTGFWESGSRLLAVACKDKQYVTEIYQLN